MSKYKHKEGDSMLNDTILQKIFDKEQIYRMPIMQQSDVIDAIEQVFYELKEEYPNATISELLSDVSE